MTPYHFEISAPGPEVQAEPRVDARDCVSGPVHDHA